MVKLFTSFFILLLSLAVSGQSVVPNLPLIAGGSTPAETAINVGRQLLGKPYVCATLDYNSTERLVVNLNAFDCTTYLESVLALSLAYHDQPGKWQPAQFDQAFRAYLTRLRYRNGKIDGYASRLHYFSDWLRDNEQKGFLTDVTGELPGSMWVAKPISYMSTAIDRYPHLSDPATLKQMQLTESHLSRQSFWFIPKKNIRLAESQLREGDIIMLTAARPGLDMKHVGLAVRQPSGRIHLMHASSDQGEVVITRYPLSDYLLWHKRLSGVRVARLRSKEVLTARD
ncbi:MAG: hypothetical protein JWP57_1669 [Spirosoma sp.]|nr:hypothetical protein [Spirosoma sp.]